MADPRETLLKTIEPREATGERWNVYVIADYGVGDGAFAEVAARLRAIHGGMSAEKLSVAPFSTISTGFWIRQMGIEDAYPGMVAFSNTAPRGSPEAIRWQGDERQRLLFAMLDTDIPVFAISSGYNWSFVKDRIKRLDDGSHAFYDLAIPNAGSQFRSRDFYPQAIARVLAKDISILGEQINPSEIPDVPRDRIAYIDGYGNIKTTTRASQFPPELVASPYIAVQIGSAKGTVYNHFVRGQQAGIGDLGLVAGSSGGSDPFLEIYKRGSSVAYAFGNPMIYDTRDPIIFTPFPLQPSIT